MFGISGPLSLHIFDPLDSAAEPQRAEHPKYFYEKQTQTQQLELLADLTHEQHGGSGSEDVDDVVADYLGQRLNTTLLPQPLVAGVLIVLKIQVVRAVRGLWSSAGRNIFMIFFLCMDIVHL